MSERYAKQRRLQNAEVRTGRQVADADIAGKATLTDSLRASHGQPLPTAVRESLEQELGEDLSGVRLHYDAKAAEVAQAYHARAFTVGQCIYFNQGQFSPDSAEGSRLIAHEVVHTVQQKGASVGDLESMDVSTPGDTHEREAEAFAASRGTPAKPVDARAAAARAMPVPSPVRVSRAVVARAVIQRDLLDGNHPAELNAAPQPVNAQEPTPAEIQAQTQNAIKQARSNSGTNGVVSLVRQLRANAGPNAGAIEAAINAELTDVEKKALEGNGNNAAPAASSGQSNAPAGRPNQGQPNTPNQPANAPAHPGNQPANQANHPNQPANGPAHANTEQRPGGEANAQGGDHAQGQQGDHAQGQHANDHGNGAANAQGHGNAAPGHEAGGDHDAGGHEEPHIPEAAGRELIEQELAFHENWRVYAEHGAAGRAGHLLQTMFIADGNGSTASRILGGDLAQGAMGAGTQFLIGQGTKLLATRTIASRVPGVGNIIGGAFSAYALFSNGGAGIQKMGHEAMHGIAGAFSAENWRESPWLTAANLVTGIKSVLEIIGHVCNILSGLAYAFAAIAAVGGLLSVLFPPLAFLVPYIPVAINFGRACGGIATACLAAANVISPIPPILRAIHLIFSDNDPIKLVEAEKDYHEQAQGALAAYGSAKLNNVAAGKGLRASARSAQIGEMKEGIEHYQSAMGGGTAPTPENFRAGVHNTEQAMGMGSGDNRSGQQIGRDYFNPESRAGANEASLDKQEKKLSQAEKDHAYTEKRADRAMERLDADPTEKNFKAAARAAETAERHEGIVHHQHHQVELAEWRTQIPTGQMGGGNVAGSAGDAADLARGRAIENAREPGEERRAENASEAYHELRHGQEEPHAERDQRGHIVLPAPPGNLEEIDSLDRQIHAAEQQAHQARETAADARQLQRETHTQATGLASSAQGVNQFVTQKSAQSSAQQARVTAQTTDMTAKTTQANSTSSQGTSSASGTIQGIASAARTVDGLLGRVPSNRFFDVSGAKNNVHQFVVGMDQLTGAPAQQNQNQQQASQATAQRTQQTGQAANTHSQATAQGNQLAQQMRTDSATAATASSQAANVAAQSTAHGQQQQSRAQQLAAERRTKWQALLSWAATHRAIREQASEGGHGGGHRGAPAGEGPAISRKASGSGMSAGADAAVAGAAGSTGAPLPAAQRKRLEQQAGVDLSGVRVHTGSASQAAASAVGAKAYTVGQDIHFGAGYYEPSSAEGEHLLAHEVAHTIQQRGGTPSRQNKLEVSSPTDHAEHEADRFADSVARGGSQVALSAGAQMVSREMLPGTNPAERMDGTPAAAITRHRAVGVGDAANPPATTAPPATVSRNANVRVVATELAPLRTTTAMCPEPSRVFQEGPAVSPTPSGYTAVTGIQGTVDAPMIDQIADPGIYIANQPSPDDVQQGGIGDCYFMAVLMAVSARDPGHIKSIMTPDGRGGATVRLWRRQQNDRSLWGWITNAAPTYSYVPVDVGVSGDLAVRITGNTVYGAQLRCAPTPKVQEYYATITGTNLEVHRKDTFELGRWAPLLEKAYARFAQQHGQYGGDHPGNGHAAGGSGYADIDGGVSTLALSVLYGAATAGANVHDEAITAFPPAGTGLLAANAHVVDQLCLLAGRGDTAAAGDRDAPLLFANTFPDAQANNLAQAIPLAIADPDWANIPAARQTKILAIQTALTAWQALPADTGTVTAKATALTAVGNACIEAARTPNLEDLANLRSWVRAPIQFENDSDVVPADRHRDLQVLGSNMDIMIGNGTLIPFNVNIVGHASTTGDAAHNQTLSENRATNVLTRVQGGFTHPANMAKNNFTSSGVGSTGAGPGPEWRKVEVTVEHQTPGANELLGPGRSDAMHRMVDLILNCRNLGTDHSGGQRNVYAGHGYSVLQVAFLNSARVAVPLQTVTGPVRQGMLAQVDPMASTVRLRNPHHGNEPDRDGMNHDVPGDGIPAGAGADGIFTMTLDAFFRNFNAVGSAVLPRT